MAISEIIRPFCMRELLLVQSPIIGDLLTNFLAKILSPLYTELQCKQVQWNTSCKTLSLEAKRQIVSKPSIGQLQLASFRPSKKGIAVVNLQEMPDGVDRSISFASRVLCKVELNYFMIQKVTLVIFSSFNKIYQYLAGNQLILIL